MGIFSPENNIFGLDIGTNNIRVVQLKPKPTKEKPALLAFGSLEIPPEIVKSENIADRQLLVEKIKELTKNAKITTKKVVATIPGTEAFTAVIKVPQMPPSELSQAIKFQAKQQIPMTLEEVKLEWQVLGKVPNENKFKVLLIACPLAIIEKYIKILEDAGLKPVALDLNPIPAIRALCFKSQETVVVLNIGAGVTDIAIFEQSEIAHLRSIPTAGNALTRAISQNLGIDVSQAEVFKKKFGLSRDKLEGEVLRSITPILDIIVEETKRSLDFYQNQPGSSPVKRIILCGGSANLPGLPISLSKSLGVEVQLGNPWVKINYSSNLENQLKEIASFFATPCGLALRNIEKIGLINLLPEVKKAQAEAKSINIFSVAAVSFALLISFALLGFLQFSKNQKEIELKKIKEEIKEVDSKIAEFGDIEKTITSVANQVNSLEGFLTNRSYTQDLLLELKRAVPRDINISSLKIGEDKKIELSGNTHSTKISAFQSLARFIKQLKEFKKDIGGQPTKVFSNVELTSISGKSPEVSYTITAQTIERLTNEDN